MERTSLNPKPQLSIPLSMYDARLKMCIMMCKHVIIATADMLIS